MSPQPSQSTNAARRVGPLLVLVALVCLAAHLPFLPKTLEDFDSINFAFGVREFDVSKHQPHPPGYPIYVALAKVSTAALRGAGVEGPEARGLAIWGVLGAALAVFPLFAVFRRFEGRDRLALFATITTVCAPLFWFTADRPLSDMTGLAVVLSAQALTLAAWSRQRDPAASPATVRRFILAASAVAGLAIGVRAQSFVLTLPLLALVIGNWRVPSSRRASIGALAALAAGVLVWAVPLVLVSGGVRAYLAVLRNQGTDDFSGGKMLWTNYRLRDIAYSLRDTFVLPWATVPLASVALTLAGAGAVIVAWRSRTALLLIATIALPYAIFHLLFQEASTVRYSLPLVPAMAYLAVVALDALSRAIGSRMAPGAGGLVLPIATGTLAAVSLVTAMPALRAYAAEPSPVAEAFSAMRAHAASTGERAVIVPHWESRRYAQWLDGELPATLLPVRRMHEWLAAVQYWREGGRGPVWFVARPGRTDLALIDPARRTLAGAYRWTFDTRAYVGGARPNGVDWYDITAPGWFLDTGWSVTPEVAGVTKATGRGPHLEPAVGYVARRSGETVLMIGGVAGDVTRPIQGDRHVHLRIDLDDHLLAEWDQPAGWFLRVLPLPAGMLAGPEGFARLAVRSSNDGELMPVKLEQFDLQPADALVWGFDNGWMELEYDPVKEQLWRWSGGKATFNICNAGRSVTIRLRGDSPLKYFNAPPKVTVTAAGRTLATFSPDGDFVQEITVPAEVLAAAHGLVVLETDRTFQPRGDPRVLGLKFYEITVR